MATPSPTGSGTPPKYDLEAEEKVYLAEFEAWRKTKPPTADSEPEDPSKWSPEFVAWLDSRPQRAAGERMVQGMVDGLNKAFQPKVDEKQEREEKQAGECPPDEPPPQAGAKVTRADLNPFALHIEKTWRRLFPAFVKALEKDGSLYETLQDREKNYFEEEEALIQGGYSPEEAQEQAERTWILTPDA